MPKKRTKDSEPSLMLNGRDIRLMPKEDIQEAFAKIRSELEAVKMSVTGLNSVRGKLMTSKYVIEEVGRQKPGVNALVQLNESIFVDGHITDTASFRIKLGAGFLVDMDKESSVKYYDWKIASVSKQADEMAGRLANTEKALVAISEHLQRLEQSAEETAASSARQ